MARSANIYTGDGATTQYAVNFTLGFISRGDVLAYVEDEVDGLGAQVYRTITWIHDGLIELSPAPANGKLIFIRRVMDKTALQHDFSDGAILNESALDESNLQLLYIMHEILDGFYNPTEIVANTGLVLRSDVDCLGIWTVKNMRTPTANTDAATKAYVDANMTAVQLAASEAEASALAAGASAAEAALSAIAAAASAAAAQFLQAGAGAVARTMQDKNRDHVHVKDFGAKLTGLLADDDTLAFQKAIDSLGAGGGTVHYNGKPYLGSDVTVKPNVTLLGEFGAVGTPMNNTSAPYGALNSSIRLASTASLRLKGGAAVQGGLLFPYGTVFPTANSAGFAGTAIILEADDCCVDTCMILGFNKAVYGNGAQRPRLNNLLLDNENCIEITACLDVPYIEKIHMWPFSGIAHPAKPANWADRTNGIWLHNSADGAQVYNCFQYGYLRGYFLDSVNGVTLQSCVSDGTGTYTGAIGTLVVNGCTGTQVLDGFAYNADIGILIATGMGQHTRVSGFDTGSCQVKGMAISGGNVTVLGGAHRDTGTAISIDTADSAVLLDGQNFYSIAGSCIDVSVDADVSIMAADATTVNKVLNVTNASAKVFIDHSRFSAVATAPITSTVPTQNLHIGEHNVWSDGANGAAMVSGTVNSPTIASADGLALPVIGDYFIVSGVVSFGGLLGGYKGRVVTLEFTGNLTMFSSTGNVNAMRHKTLNPTVVPGSVFTFKHSGDQWVEI